MVTTAAPARLAGELHFDSAMRTLYATDASEYQELPAAVALPRTEADVGELIAFAHRHRLGLIPRTAGTSLAGQVVGAGIVVDIGRHLNRIVAIDAARRRVRVQPGVVRNELNLYLKPHGLFFAPETSTANRAMIGGMVGNNSCGANSIVYGTTREHLVSARGFLSDGSEVTFGPLTAAEFAAKCAGPDTLETRIYRTVRDLLGDAENRQLIRDHYPKPTVTRRNTGYALDRLMDCAVFDPASDKPFNLCRLLAGSEGTLFLGVEFELNCEPLPPPGALMCAHFRDHPGLAARHAHRDAPPAERLRADRPPHPRVHQGQPRAGEEPLLRAGRPGRDPRHRDPPRAARAAIEAEMRALEAELRAAGPRLRLPRALGRRRQQGLGPAPRRPGPDDQRRRATPSRARSSRTPPSPSRTCPPTSPSSTRSCAANTASAASTTPTPAPASCTPARSST